VVNPIVRGSLVFFNTWIPNSSACSSGGTGFLMSVEQFNGGEPDAPAFNVNADAVADKDDFVTSGNTNHAAAGEAYVNGLPAQSTFLSNKQYTPGTGSKVIETRDVADLGGPGTGRLSWQQLSNN
jgi:type IV pilus assembly protein PilY1